MNRWKNFRCFEAAVDLVYLSHDTQVFDKKGVYALELANNPHMSKSDVEQRFLAMIFIENACTVRYTALWKELSNLVAMKMDNYPKTLSEATYLLTHWKDPVNTTGRSNLAAQAISSQSKLSFMQRYGSPLQCQEIKDNKNGNGTIKGTDGSTHAHIKCHNCHWADHYASKCPAPRQGRHSYGFTHCTFNQVHIGGLLPTAIIIDTCSTFNSFFNKQLLDNV